MKQKNISKKGQYLLSVFVVFSILWLQVPAETRAKNDVKETCPDVNTKPFTQESINGTPVQKATKSIKSDCALSYPEQPWALHEHAYYNNSFEETNPQNAAKKFKKVLVSSFRVHLDKNVEKYVEMDQLVCGKPPKNSTNCTGQELDSADPRWIGGVQVTLSKDPGNTEYPYMITWDYGAKFLKEKTSTTHTEFVKWAGVLPTVNGANPDLDGYYCDQKNKTKQGESIYAALEYLCGHPSAQYKNRNFNGFDPANPLDGDKSAKLLQMLSKNVLEKNWTIKTKSEIQVADLIYPDKSVTPAEYKGNKVIWKPEGGSSAYPWKAAEGKNLEDAFYWFQIGIDTTTWERSDFPDTNFCSGLTLSADTLEEGKKIALSVKVSVAGKGNIQNLQYTWEAKNKNVFTGTFDNQGFPGSYKTKNPQVTFSGALAETEITVSASDDFHSYPKCTGKVAITKKPPPKTPTCEKIDVTQDQSDTNKPITFTVTPTGELTDQFQYIWSGVNGIFSSNKGKTTTFTISYKNKDANIFVKTTDQSGKEYNQCSWNKIISPTPPPPGGACTKLDMTSNPASPTANGQPVIFTVTPTGANIDKLTYTWTTTTDGLFDTKPSGYNTSNKNVQFSGTGNNGTVVAVIAKDEKGNSLPQCNASVTLNTSGGGGTQCATLKILSPEGPVYTNTTSPITIKVEVKNANGGDYTNNIAYSSTTGGTFQDSNNVASSLATTDKQVTFSGGKDGTIINIDAGTTACHGAIPFIKPKTTKRDDAIDKKVQGVKTAYLSKTNDKGTKVKYEILYTPVIPNKMVYAEITDNLWNGPITGTIDGKIYLDNTPTTIQEKENGKTIKLCKGDKKTWIAPCAQNNISSSKNIIVYGATKPVLITYYGIVKSRAKCENSGDCGEIFKNKTSYVSWDNTEKAGDILSGESMASIHVLCPFMLSRGGGDLLFEKDLNGLGLTDISQCTDIKTSDEVVLKPKEEIQIHIKTGTDKPFDATHKICERSNILPKSLYESIPELKHNQPTDYKNPLENISSLLCEFETTLNDTLLKQNVEQSISDNRYRVGRWSVWTGYSGTTVTTIFPGQDVFRLQKRNLILGNITTSSFTNIRPVTFIVEDGDIHITRNIDTMDKMNGTIALIALNGNIIIDPGVTKISAVLFAQKGDRKDTATGEIRGNGPSQNILTIVGSVYGDIANIVGSRKPIGQILNLANDESAFTVKYDERLFFYTPPVLQDLLNLSQTETVR